MRWAVKQRVNTGMAIFYVHIGKYNGQIRKVVKHGNVNLADFYRGVQVFIGFGYKPA
jgi:hypothetical protein